MSATTARRVLVVDNYDSFVYTIVGYLEQLGADCHVVRNDAVTASEAARYDGVLVSPGPGTPEEAGVSVAIIEECARTRTPMFGVCLGHQALAVVFGATVDRAPELLHGKTSLVHHDATGVLQGLPSPFTATRYHSLTVDPSTLPAELVATGHTDSGIVMALRHVELPLHGVQFHPESVLTQGGHRMLANFLAECGDEAAVDRSAGLSPLVTAAV
ncbi:aminodeoxychorismate/anthranilate synthase component II [Intrasporangium calvum]|uniref:Glutamine amidotransferase of anthranilate synthase n=1 Tax=Intrasporangium calvum (strain ATCC 23552 / DSM 43043 / JCM 3097 / NBRC 12989 / NCIMB 10167 / NRRL B-3866 / 7 KIP) TaxID=710696 RepID=E6SEM2_INTC7|nr:aminodeoxychorismate/anthranilate synthase component II [Intrasporangium calvum]ADU46623.1 glutamine amidotransferase of anthranilate synthase [Intrasporangium calvum DSM 43043]AXG14995.1 aminodeoxychorismate/anthranilate synthase component II [Intrasporangium calvum]